MSNIGFNITVHHLFSPISTLCSESKSYTLTSCSYNLRTLQINQLFLQLFNKVFHKLRSKLAVYLLINNCKDILTLP
jgi:hypothetical protein